MTSPTASGLPVIALVGRANVGKSTLFNALTRSRDALVGDRPGVTRDRQYGFAAHAGRRFIVCDTAGLSDEHIPLAQQTARQTEQALAEADGVLLLVDARAGPNAADDAVVRRVRTSGKPAWLVANKVDGLKTDDAVAEFYRLGFGEPQGVSAEHGFGVPALLDEVLAAFPAGEEAPEDVEEGVRVAIVGRPNVGKSTLVNRLLGEERVLTLDFPGTTRDAIRIPFVRDGQRALIVAPPRSGKTIFLQQMAQAIARNHTEIHLIMLLLDERPEEVTDMRRAVQGEVFASSNDAPLESHLRLAQLATEYAKRKAECGEDVVVLLDSLTRTGRAFNLGQRGSGRTMSGGLDARALEIPRKIFGAGRKIENGGSLTIAATILVGTGSRMDEFIFEEFKGTGNMELVLDRALADQRIFPAINIPASGTRREELIFGKQTAHYQTLRRAIHGMPAREAMSTLLKAIATTPNNKALLKKISENSADFA